MSFLTCDLSKKRMNKKLHKFESQVKNSIFQNLLDFV